MLLMLTTGRRFHRRGPPRRGRRNTISRAFQTECLRNHSAQSVKLALVVFEATEAAATAAEGEITRFVQICADRADGFPAGWPGTFSWWRRGDSTFRGFRRGLDYAFIPVPFKSPWMRSVLSGRLHHPNPSARPGVPPRRVYESLQGRSEVSLLPTPRRCHATLARERRQVSPM